ncbi:MAG: ferrochelatase [Hyphomonas sp.]|uniref:ferrochelatase n=1 Tax=Hyphomonas sp. TaxID=87 RepID=UPI00181A08E6|nr:ferrochelatase [Hyphomonas sp.]MBA3070466.1 ferrochelatase [Hyphomonas sp.]MBU3921106.1 ferrochelatase [Alphaproteobacteria bacterium]MBU4061996.1 ferrochelatase [Alphaproteobacteria bacterium]MBU4164932.1 ferrochelatase [Alphaproteobacteria bacterium]
MGRRIAVVLFNLGGPDKPASVQPFLQNLFRDAAIIRAPLPVRWFLARLISRTRAPAVKKNYAMMDAGGGSPLLRETEAQASALEASLAASLPGDEVKCFIAMRYWHPFTEEAAADVKRWKADEVILLPLYPQFSTTTTGSSLEAWRKAYPGPTRTVCCYPFDENFVAAHVDRILDAHRKAGAPDQVTLLLSAHGLPEQVVRGGDPYQWQCEALAEMIAGRVPAGWEVIGCYQSRVGPLKWIGPATDAQVERAAREGKHILIAPIAFVSEHIETLVELGEEYRLLATSHGAASYTRVEALGTHKDFIQTLAQETLAALGMKGTLRSCAGGRLCPSEWSGCPHAVRPQKAGERVNETTV